MSAMNNTELNYTNFDEFLQGKTVVVDFWAEWCYPCKVQHRILDEIAEENESHFTLARLNVDDNRVIAARLGVSNIPTLIIFAKGRELRRIIGLQSREILEKQILNAIQSISNQNNFNTK